MMKLAATTALVLSLAAPTFAHAGKEHRAQSLGVNADDFTMNELIRLEEAIREGETNTVNFILSQAGDDVVSTQSGVSAAKAHRARALGVDPEDFTMNELIRLGEAIREGETNTVYFTLSQAGDEVVPTQNGVSAAKAHRARALGVDPEAFTMNQLIRLEEAIREGETNTVNFILSQAS